VPVSVLGHAIDSNIARLTSLPFEGLGFLRPTEAFIAIHGKFTKI
jgi:hypothetical protein